MADQFLTAKKDLPVLGIGLGLRREMIAETIQNSDQIDWLEITPENYMNLGGAARSRLEKAAACFPLVSHGVNLSLGSTDPLNEDYLDSIKKLLDEVDAPWWSDHLCFASIGGTYMHDLLPLPFSREAVKHIASRVRYIQHKIGRPFLIENISFYMHMPGNEMTESQFLSEILQEADCGLLLDVNNIYVNSQNHKFDAAQFLNEIPLERVVQIHMAGHAHNAGRIIDTHGAAVIEPVYDLLANVLSRTKVHAVMLERDQHFPPFEEIIAELKRFRALADMSQPALNAMRRTTKTITEVPASIIGSNKGRDRAAALTA